MIEEERAVVDEVVRPADRGPVVQLHRVGGEDRAGVVLRAEFTGCRAVDRERATAGGGSGGSAEKTDRDGEREEGGKPAERHGHRRAFWTRKAAVAELVSPTGRQASVIGVKNRNLTLNAHGVPIRQKSRSRNRG